MRYDKTIMFWRDGKSYIIPEVFQFKTSKKVSFYKKLMVKF